MMSAEETKPQTETGAEEGSTNFQPKPGMPWYVVHTYSGFEHKAKLALQERVRSVRRESDFGEIVVPEENVVELVKGQKKTTKRRFFPGYILVQVNLTDETWHIVKNTPRITGFVGGDKVRP
jgi:transcriptional antiterminator NusG